MNKAQQSYVSDAKNEIDLILTRFDYYPINNLAEHIARLCNVEIGDLYTSLDKSQIAQARWLLWYAYRYASNETYEMIAKRTYFCGHGFCARAVAAGIEKMSKIIEQNEIWHNKWLVIKHIIKSEKKQKDDERVSMTLHVPKSIKNKINIEIKQEK